MKQLDIVDKALVLCAILSIDVVNMIKFAFQLLWILLFQVINCQTFQRHPILSRPSCFKTAPSLQSTSMSVELFSPLDTNRDGRISVDDLVHGSAGIMRHSPLLSSLMINFKQFLTGKRCTMSLGQLFTQLSSLVSLSDIFIIGACWYFYKPLLDQLYKLKQRFIGEFEFVSYKDSIFGRMEQPIKLLILFPIVLFVIDVITILLTFLGFQFHIKSNFPQFFSNIAFSIITGSFLTRFKDWVSSRLRRSYWKVQRNNKVKRDLIQEKTTDEVTSAVIWAIVAISSLQTLSAQFGVGIKSIFALGGLGSASFVLALRSTMENILGGLLLRLQDKFRVNEKITLPNSKEEGFIENIHWLSTKVRRDDDSTITVPNANFIQGEVINWSRTPYRLFRTIITVKENQIRLLPEIIENVRTCLQNDVDIESKDRDLIVAATGFNSGNIIVEISARLKGNNDATIGAIKTRVVDKIASEVDSVFKKHNMTKA